MIETDGKGTLKEGSFHPAAPSAMKFINSMSLIEQINHMESFSSVALSGNKSGEICGETLRRIMEDEPVSDRYLLGLAWFIKMLDDDSDD